MTTRAYPWCAFTILLVLASLLSIFAFPWPPPMIGVVLGWVALAGLVGAGLYFGREYGLGTPYLNTWCAGGLGTGRDWLRLAAAPLGGVALGATGSSAQAMANRSTGATMQWTAVEREHASIGSSSNGR